MLLIWTWILTSSTSASISGRYTAMIQNMTNIGRQLGIQSTPTFAINGQGVVGAKDFTEFATIIDSFLTVEP